MGYKVIFDSSKTSIGHVFRPMLWRRSGSDLKAVLAIRPLRGVLTSRIARGKRDGRAQTPVRRLQLALETLVSWHFANTAACFYRPVIVCTDHLVRSSNLEETVSNLVRNLGLEHGEAEGHMVAGNRMRHAQLSVVPEEVCALPTMERLVAYMGVPLYVANIPVQNEMSENNTFTLVLGSGRSGTTVLFQRLCEDLRCGYVTSVGGAFPRLSVPSAFLSRFTRRVGQGPSNEAVRFLDSFGLGHSRV